MNKVRLLFAPENTGFADKLASALAQSGYDPTAEDDPASAALVIWSQASAASKPILSAARSALARRVLVPVAFGKTPPPPSFEHLWPMDLAGWNGRADDPRWKFVLDELELATRRGVVFRPIAANDHGEAPSRRVAAPAPPAKEPLAAAEDPEPALFAEEQVETIRPRPKLPRIAIGAGLMIAAVAGAGAAALLIGAADGRRAAAKEPAIAFVVRQRPQSIAVEPVGADDPGLNAVDDLRDGDLPPLPADEPPTDELAATVGAEAEAPILPTEAAPVTPDAPSAGAVDDADPIAGLAWSATSSPDAETAFFGRYLRDCIDCPDLAELDAGSFLMGAAPGEPAAKAFEGPQASVTLPRKIAMAVRETTFEEWGRCVDEGGCQTVADAGWGRGKRPVINVTRVDAEAYAAWLSAKTGQRYRLPTEAEWEYAARAGSAGPFSFGPKADVAHANFDAAIPDPLGVQGRRRGQPAPVGAYAPNAFGLFDMHGNVWEWTADCWRPSHDGRPADASAVSGLCAARVIKGGAFSAPASSLRSAHRDGAVDGARRNDVGFRLVREMD